HRLGKMRQRCTNVTEVDLEKLLPAAEIPDHFDRFGSGHFAAFQPASAAQADTDVGAVGDLDCAFVALEVGEDAARHAGEHRLRRVIRMNADADARLLGHRDDLLDEVGVVLPDLFLAVDAPVGERTLEGLASPVAFRVGAGEVQGGAGVPARQDLATAAPDPVPHVSVSRVGNAGLPQVADVVEVLLDLFVASRQVERDLFHVVKAAARAHAAADVIDLETARFPLLANLDEPCGGSGFRSSAKAPPGDPELFEVEEVLWHRLSAGGADLDPGRDGNHLRRTAG